MIPGYCGQKLTWEAEASRKWDTLFLINEGLN